MVPVYNPGDRFEKCLDSIVNQTLREIEIIIVLDCPTDGSEKIAERYAKHDNRIKLAYNEKNLHVGLSRNVGLEMATGEYIGFIDSDDYIELSMYDKMYSFAVNENLEMVRCNLFIQDGNTITKHIMSKEPDNPDELRNYYIINNLQRTKGFGYCCICIYKTDMINKHGLKFVDSKTINREDRLFNLCVLLTAQKIRSVPDYLYYYVQNPQGITNSKNSIKNHSSTKSCISYCEKVYDLMNTKGNNPQFASALLISISKMLYTAFLNGFGDSFKMGLQGFRLIASNKTLAKPLSDLFKRKNFHILFRLKPTVFLFVLLVKMCSK